MSASASCQRQHDNKQRLASIRSGCFVYFCRNSAARDTGGILLPPAASLPGPGSITLSVFKPCVIIPVYNHHQVIARVVEQVVLYGLPCILVDDGSDRDHVKPILEAYAAQDPRIRVELLDNKNSFLKWGSILIIANLTPVDSEKRFDRIFKKYYAPIIGPAMVTAANIIGGSVKIVSATISSRARGPGTCSLRPSRNCSSARRAAAYCLSSTFTWPML